MFSDRSNDLDTWLWLPEILMVGSFVCLVIQIRAAHAAGRLSPGRLLWIVLFGFLLAVGLVFSFSVR